MMDKSIEELLKSFPDEFLGLGKMEQRVSLQLYRMLAQGRPVARKTLAAALNLSGDVVSNILRGWPGVYHDEDQNIIGYWGLALPEMDHRFEINGRTLYTWCAWDSLFIPELLHQIARVNSMCPNTGEEIRLTITPHGIEHRHPASTVMSFVKPDAAKIRQDVILHFCKYVYFFSSADEATRWVTNNPGTLVLSLETAYELGRKKNRAQYRDVLDDPLPATTSRTGKNG